ncbi:MAG: sugar phosphate isomerase/epimerase family protein [Capsulimonadales bacterium]|nr:sugar phosphate isomerase/epimerase family protein [Capsulimonadales bacterium]
MKIAVQHNLVPGASLGERFERAAGFGFEAVEITAWGFPDPIANHVDEIVAASRASGLPVSTLCSMGGDDFVHPDPAERKKRLDGLVAYLEAAEAIGARGVVALPIRPPVRLPDLSPAHTERDLITDIAVAQLTAALERTPDVKAAIFLEPLNRYEANYLRTVAHGAELAAKVGSPRVQVLADVFHMNIEEADMAATLRTHRESIGAVHLADSNRLLPGHGHIEFVTLLEALFEIGFDGYCALECGVPGDPTETLPECAEYLKKRREIAASNRANL